mmetsp:Transcript_14100/g.30360  ORF Transcript_14100/g.30360 Transcript_14100/m.30360 type:complete len:327 (-) Transcript_14100:109-1089(-)|eukprot:CAMPEP_0185843790 /NCGR_PEP_ID=MMETSP1354-20130828/194_1 /TAXON_ID=708628 /ORGANISM="Erythrolobus madagascarensis, Strain CCMP3276" /LENGTH=326 /DNA_ID=CAMNT_0028543349 /DNA_START=187 /DNA_END=1167 /DNA_ORIENTATION=-
MAGVTVKMEEETEARRSARNQKLRRSDRIQKLMEQKVKAEAASKVKSEAGGSSTKKKSQSKPAKAIAKSEPAKSKKAGLKSKVKRGMGGTGTVHGVLGVVDPASGLNGKIYSWTDSLGTAALLDVMAVLVDPSKNMDKYYVIQLVTLGDDESDSMSDGEDEKEDVEYAVFQRWGRTGTSGQSLTLKFDDLEAAFKCFEDKFKDKVGLTWDTRANSAVSGKYRFVLQDFTKKQLMSMGEGNVGQWQYWVDDNVDGKRTDWYDYDSMGNLLTEQLYLESQTNSWLFQRVVQSGAWQYLVDLQQMTQTNVVHPAHTTRRIRRVPPESEE